MNIRNVQQANRSFCGMHGYNPGNPCPISKETLCGPGKMIEEEPVCPAGGTYTWLEGKSPKIGELMLRCSCPDHVPEDHSEW
jgi:hypothetical protein